MEKIKILVVQHKEAEVYHDDVYTPIQVGKAISKVDLGILGDDTGDNISEKNPYYCELTAQYWAWKNMHDVEYIGFCHYRRYFETIITCDNIDQLLDNDKSVIIAKPVIEPRSMFSHLQYSLCWEDVFVLMASLKIAQPQYFDTAMRYMKGNKCYPCNMLVMKKEMFDRYAEWLFSIMDEVERHLRPSGYTRQKRAYGYMSELLLPIWCIENGMTMKFENRVSMVGRKFKKSIKIRLKEFYFNVTHHLMYYDKLPLKDSSMGVGLRADGFDAFGVIKS